MQLFGREGALPETEIGKGSGEGFVASEMGVAAKGAVASGGGRKARSGAGAGRLGWSRAQLAARRKSDPGKLALAARVRLGARLHRRRWDGEWPASA